MENNESNETVETLFLYDYRTEMTVTEFFAMHQKSDTEESNSEESNSEETPKLYVDTDSEEESEVLEEPVKHRGQLATKSVKRYKYEVTSEEESEDLEEPVKHRGQLATKSVKKYKYEVTSEEESEDPEESEEDKGQLATKSVREHKYESNSEEQSEDLEESEEQEQHYEPSSDSEEDQSPKAHNIEKEPEEPSIVEETDFETDPETEITALREMFGNINYFQPIGIDTQVHQLTVKKMSDHVPEIHTPMRNRKTRKLFNSVQDLQTAKKSFLSGIALEHYFKIKKYQ